MIVQTIQIKNHVGLHARPSAQIASAAEKFESQIQIKYRDRTVNARGAVGIIMLGVEDGEEIEITISGEDEQEAYHNLNRVFYEINHLVKHP